MLTCEEFIRYILEPGSRLAPRARKGEGLDYFEDHEASPPGPTNDAPIPQSFGRYLLPLLFGSSGQDWSLLEGSTPLLPPVGVKGLKRLLPSHALVWDRKTEARGPRYVVLVEFVEIAGRQMLKQAGPLFSHLGATERIEDALDRIGEEVLEGLRKRAASKDSRAVIIPPEETLCVVSVRDDREAPDGLWLLSFATHNKENKGLETFRLQEEVRTWDKGIARQHLEALFHRSFSKLPKAEWQDAFTTADERKKATKLLEICTRPSPKQSDIQKGVLDLLETIATGFGLPARRDTGRRLHAIPLPSDHDIGMNAEPSGKASGRRNPFPGITLRDERSRLVGYIVYALERDADATRLRKHLEANNRFHNVLVVYPAKGKREARLELWQGCEQLTGRLRKSQGAGYKDEAAVINLLSRFFVVSRAKVRNPRELAEELAYRAKYLQGLAQRQLAEERERGPLRDLYDAFRAALVHDQSEKDFSDAFAQTVTYGLLTARWLGADEIAASGRRLTRLTALAYLPSSSRFLNDFFAAVLSVDFDDRNGRFLWLVDDLADLLDRIDVKYVFGPGDKDSDSATDPVIHFYEPFLAAYDKELKNKRGVFFTPRPVVSFIVRSVHGLLQKEFGLEDGLASTDTWGDVAKRIAGLRIPEGVKATDPFVCILDPATGTGTFLFECIEVIERTMKDRWCRELKKKEKTDPAVSARWEEYVPKHLLSRLYGYEIMVASYAVAHLKLSSKLRETGYRAWELAQISVHLTNSLEPSSDSGQQQLPGMFAALAHEAAAVNDIKRNKRFSVVIGNPPYSVSSHNKSAFIEKLMATYKAGLQRERNIQPLSDDYLKFMRLAEYILSTSSKGVFGFITNHSYLSGVIHRTMRKSFMSTFDAIHVTDLHGNSFINEHPPEGVRDTNVFDIQQGVSLCIACRREGGATEIRFSELWGTGVEKLATLGDSTRTIESKTINPDAEYAFFVPKDFSEARQWSLWPELTDVFKANQNGVQTGHDAFSVAFERETAAQHVEAFISPRLTDREVSARYDLGDNSGWSFAQKRRQLLGSRINKKLLVRYYYRPFDFRYIYYHPDLLKRPSPAIMPHLLDGDNVALFAMRKIVPTFAYTFFGVVNSVVDHGNFYMGNQGSSSCFPLYVRPTMQPLGSRPDREHNFQSGFLEELRRTLGVDAVAGGLPVGLTPEDIFHYAYAVFHSPGYRRLYAEFLKIDFPRLPLTGTLALFRTLVNLGGELTSLHLLKSPRLDRSPAEFIGGSKEVSRVGYVDHTVWIDASGSRDNTVAGSSGFRGVPEAVWRFQIGGYQVCEKWLKDRKGRTLSMDDIEHYPKIVVAISETIRIMKEIDEVIDKHGGWPGAFAAKAAGGKR